jgi:hypothetical protein
VEIDPRPDRDPYMAWVREAAARALDAHPGPVGEVLARELRAYAQFGHRFGGDGLLHRLAADIHCHSTASATMPIPATATR